MKKQKNILFLFVFVISISSAQKTTIDILKKHSVNQLIGHAFYNNKSNEEVIEIKSSDNYSKKDTSKIIFEIHLYEKGRKKGRVFARYDESGRLKKSFKHNISTFLSRAYRFITYLPNRISGSTKYDAELNLPLIIRDSQNQIQFVKVKNWEETYKYDSKGNLIEIYNNFNSKNSDSSRSLFCGSIALQWKGKYQDNNLIEEETTWDIGKTIRTFHTWENDTLIESRSTSFITGDTRKTRYVYVNNKISQVLEYLENGKLVSKKVYKWNKNSE